MAKATSSKTTTTGEQAEFPLTLSEFCTRLSSDDRRVELISAFAAIETKAGRVKDTETNFKARFVAFVNQPA